MIKDLHQNYCQKNKALQDWFCHLSKDLSYPIYSSYDIRDSGFKVSNVDANIYPGGFNNICPTDKESAGDIFKKYLKSHYGEQVKKLLLLTEEHTNNPYYWDNVSTIKTLLEEEAEAKTTAEQPAEVKAAE